MKLKFKKGDIRTERGFTLVEILLVSSILLVVAVGVTSSFVQGIHVFDRLNSLQKEEEMALFLEKLTKDIKNSTDFSRIPAQVRTNSITFGVCEEPLIENASWFDAQPIRVTYAFNAETKEVIRTKDSSLFGQKKPVSMVLAERVENLEFEPVNPGPRLPLRIAVTTVFGPARNLKKIRKVISIPKLIGAKTEA